MSLTMKEKILDAAESRVRGAGFSEMSFRDLADDVGIKSASVHYHFRTKHDLGAALVERYSLQFKAKLDDLDTDDLASSLKGFVALYAEALVPGKAICLCAIMGAEAIGLPPHVNRKTRDFFAMNVAWLEALFAKHATGEKPDAARLMVAALEGAMIMASASDDRSFFDTVASAAIAAVMNTNEHGA